MEGGVSINNLKANKNNKDHNKNGTNGIQVQKQFVDFLSLNGCATDKRHIGEKVSVKSNGEKTNSNIQVGVIGFQKPSFVNIHTNVRKKIAVFEAKQAQIWKDKIHSLESKKCNVVKKLPPPIAKKPRRDKMEHSNEMESFNERNRVL